MPEEYSPRPADEFLSIRQEFQSNDCSRISASNIPIAEQNRLSPGSGRLPADRMPAQKKSQEEAPAAETTLPRQWQPQP